MLGCCTHCQSYNRWGLSEVMNTGEFHPHKGERDPYKTSYSSLTLLSYRGHSKKMLFLEQRASHKQRADLLTPQLWLLNFQNFKQ